MTDPAQQHVEHSEESIGLVFALCDISGKFPRKSYFSSNFVLGCLWMNPLTLFPSPIQEQFHRW